MEQPMVDVILPIYRPDKTLCLLLQKLQEQTFTIHKVILVNTEQQLWEEFLQKEKIAEFFAGLSLELELFHVNKEDFDHGGTRRQAAARSKAPYFVCLTQDAVPENEHLLEHLLAPMADAKVAVVYGRQKARPDCSPIEAYTRSFNYPMEDMVKSKEDIPRLGIKTFFCSDVCAIYRKSVFEALGGFEEHTILNEDMLYAGRAVYAGWRVAYASEAVVIHSHNYGGRQQYRRNFDIAVSQAQHPEIFAGIRSEAEGIRMVKNTAGHLLTIKKPWLIVELVWQSAWKYMGYRAGKKYKTMKHAKILRRTMNPDYWYSLWKREQQQQEE